MVSALFQGRIVNIYMRITCWKYMQIINIILNELEKKAHIGSGGPPEQITWWRTRTRLVVNKNACRLHHPGVGQQNNLIFAAGSCFRAQPQVCGLLEKA